MSYDHLLPPERPRGYKAPEPPPMVPDFNPAAGINILRSKPYTTGAMLTTVGGFVLACFTGIPNVLILGLAYLWVTKDE